MTNFVLLSLATVFSVWEVRVINRLKTFQPSRLTSEILGGYNTTDSVEIENRTKYVIK